MLNIQVFCVLCLTKFTTITSMTLLCDPLDNVSYHKQLDECIQCEKCPAGYGKITLEESDIVIDPPYGSSSCIPCRPCKPGYYSDVHAYKCKLCTICTDLNKSERKHCTSKEDTVCGEPQSIVKKDTVETDEGDGHTISVGLQSDTIAGIVSAVIIIIIIIMIIVGAFGYRYWKSKRAQRRHAVQAEAGQYGSYDNVICSDSPHQEQGKQCTYKKHDERNNHCDTEDEEDDETKALIPPSGRYPFRRKRTRLFTYPFCEFQGDDSESDENICDIEQDSNLSLSKRYSYPDVSFTKVSAQSNILDSGYTDFTSRQEPHKILMSFNVPDKNSVIEKVQTWDCKYNWSEKNIHRSTVSAFNFLATYASGQKSALQKVQRWENKEELSTKFMSKVARNLGPRYKFRSLARELGLSDTDLVNIQQNYKDDVVEQGYQVLLKLKQKELIQRESDVINKIHDLGFDAILAKIY
ncbi:uncharacterized protein LOC127714456 [Mytilus californianus]|uniref:uncharacterized protein LOC127714456 n=1 Tax=Mytilus californianus TaxID=6549 RepID=UPI0022462F51|nr:uncharacterized protein LOC127714456 [Mytilus californianus]